MQNNKSISIHWHRRDLRLNENPAVEFLQQKKTPWFSIFCFDENFLSRKDFSANRFSLFLKTLRQLQKEYEAKGGTLLLINEVPQIAFLRIFQFLKKENFTIENFTFNRDYEPFARKRDQEILDLCKEASIPVQTFQDHLIFEPHMIHKADGSFYQVFTPYSQKWLQEFSKIPKQKKEKMQKKLCSFQIPLKFPYQDSLQRIHDLNLKK